MTSAPMVTVTIPYRQTEEVMTRSGKVPVPGSPDYDTRICVSAAHAAQMAADLRRAGRDQDAALIETARACVTGGAA